MAFHVVAVHDLGSPRPSRPPSFPICKTSTVRTESQWSREKTKKQSSEMWRERPAPGSPGLLAAVSFLSPDLRPRPHTLSPNTISCPFL